jgi:uncharacterized protein (DUF58 family)
MNPPRNSFRGWWQRRWSRWLDRRLPPAPLVRLHHKTLFIFPSRFGALYLFMVLMLYLLGTNFQNNLILAMALLLLSLFITCIWHCYRNLAGLTVTTRPTAAHGVGNSVRFCVHITADGRPRFALQLGAAEGAEELLPQLEQQGSLGVTFHASRRGWLHPGRLRLSSHYPLGLLTCWSLLDLEHSALIYPAPIAGPVTLSHGPGAAAEEPDPASYQQPMRVGHQPGSDELVGLRPYRAGEPLSQVAWKQQAQGRGMLSKEFAAEPWQQHWLRLQHTPGQDLEARLGRLAYAVLQLESRRQRYGLDLGTVLLPPDTGAEQQQAALQALALYGQ